jgi:hypothetical protein
LTLLFTTSFIHRCSLTMSRVSPLAESLYAVFEVKHTLTSRWLGDAGRKAASVRKLRRTSTPLLIAGSIQPPKPPSIILAGVLSLDSTWVETFPERASARLQRMPPEERLDLGCALRHAHLKSRTPPSTSASPMKP